MQLSLSGPQPAPHDRHPSPSRSANEAALPDGPAAFCLAPRGNKVTAYERPVPADGSDRAARARQRALRLTAQHHSSRRHDGLGPWLVRDCFDAGEGRRRHGHAVGDPTRAVIIGRYPSCRATARTARMAGSCPSRSAETSTAPVPAICSLRRWRPGAAQRPLTWNQIEPPSHLRDEPSSGEAVVGRVPGPPSPGADAARCLLRGVESGSVLSWKAIPYAAPPVGPLR